MAVGLPTTKFKCELLIDVLHARASSSPHQIAYRFLPDNNSESQTITYDQLDKQARALAAKLQKQYTVGDRAILLYEPGIALISAFFGCLYAGLIAVLVNPPVNQRAVHKLGLILKNAKPSCLLSTQIIQTKLLSSNLLNADKYSQLLNNWLLTDQMECDQIDSWKYPAVDAASIAFLQYTSGSTSDPKGVMISHDNILHNISLIFTASGLNKDSVIASWLPPYHDMGLINGILVPVYAGVPSILMSPASFLENPLLWLKCISDYQVTATGSPDFGYEYCIKKISEACKAQLNLSSWVVAFNGAEPIRIEVLENFYKAFKSCGFRHEAFYPCYGLAEATLFVSGAKFQQGYQQLSLNKTALEKNIVEFTEKNDVTSYPLISTGYLGQTVKIVDPTTQQICADNQIGEIWIHSPSVSIGYWENPTATQATFHNYLNDEFGEAYLKSGDLGFIHAENLYITGRLKDLIIIRGRNLYPQDIEATIAASHSALIAHGGAAFTAVDTDQDELVIVQEVKADQSNFEEICAAMIKAVLRDYEITPQRLILIQARTLPKTTSGKVQRRACRDLLKSGELKIVHEWIKPVMAATVALPVKKFSPKADSYQVIQEWLSEWLATAIGQNAASINVQQSFAYYGLDSVKAVQLCKDLSDWLGLKINPAILWEHSTVAGLSHYLTQQLGLETASVTEIKTNSAEIFQHEPIAIVGMGCRFPGDANTPEQFWQVLQQGIDPIKTVTERWSTYDIDYPSISTNADVKKPADYAGLINNIDQFDAAFFAISPREAESLDPQQRLLLEVTWEAFENAGINVTALKGSKTGIFVGISTSDYGALIQRQLDFNNVDPYLGTGSALAAAAGRLAYFLGVRGQAIAVDTACSSSLVAVHNACQDLWEHECEIAIAGGVNLILSPVESLVFSQAGMLAKDGHCKTFDASADGYVRSEGCGVIILKRLKDAERDGDRILAVIKGTAVNQDGASNGFTAPSGEAQVELIKEALQKAHLTPNDIDYIEAHGTGTSLGDPIEVRSIASVFKGQKENNKPLVIGSVKSNVGHLEAAAGMAGLFKVILALQHQKIPSNLHLKEANPLIDIQAIPAVIPTDNFAWVQSDKPRRAGINSFGFTGTNAHLILEEAPPKKLASNEVERTHHLLTLSAKTENALKELINNYQLFLEANPTINLADVAYTANVGRSHFDYRVAIVAENNQQLIESLAAENLAITKVNLNQVTKVAFLFTGQGSQYSGMGKVLYETQPVFKQYLDECATLLEPYLGKALIDLLFNVENEPLLNQTCYTQPALFALEYALAKLWMSWGVRPKSVLGHSVGEYVAATIAGAMDLAAGIKLIVARAKLMQALPAGGAMAAINLNHIKITEKLKNNAIDQQINIAAINSATQTVISGDGSAVEKFIQSCNEQNIKAQRLSVSHAFHSYLMEPMLAEFRKVAESIEYRKPEINFISNVTGSQQENITADYWVKHVRAAVLFVEGVQALQAQDCNLMIEIGPQPVLLSMCMQCWQTDSLNNKVANWLPSLRHKKNDYEQLLDSLGKFYSYGNCIDWQAFDAGYHRNKQVLPLYPFQHQRYWIKYTNKNTFTTNQFNFPLLPGNKHPLLMQQLESPQIAATIYSAEINQYWPEFVPDHIIYDVAALAGAVHVSTVLAGVHELTQAEFYQLNKIELLSPVILTENTARQLQTIFNPLKNEQQTFEIFSAEKKKEEKSSLWSLHVRGTWRKELEPLMLAADETLEAVQKRCQQKYTGDVVYQKIRDLSLELRGHFRWLERIYVGDNEVLGELRLPMDVSESNGYVLYPGLIDSMFVTVMGFFMQASSAEVIYVPFSIESFTYDARVGKPAWVRAVKRQQDNNTISADLWLFADDGQLVGKLKSIVYKAASSKTFLKSIQKAESSNFYETVWQPQPLKITDNKTVSAKTNQEAWLVFVDDLGLAPALIKQLQAQGNRCIQITYQAESQQIEWVESGEDNYCLTTLSTPVFSKFLKYILQKTNLAGIIYGWIYSAPCDAHLSLNDLKQVQHKEIGSLLFLVQALLAEKNEEIPVWLLTQHVQPVDQTGLTGLLQTPAIALHKTFLLEYSTLDIRHIDVDKNSSFTEQVAQVLTELSQDAQEDQTAYRQGIRYVPRLVEANLDKNHQNKSGITIAEEGCYLITGGLGGLGLQFAQWLINQGAKHLVLLSRRTPNNTTQKLIEDWQHQNIKVSIFANDIADSQALTELFNNFGNTLPTLKGIIHAAGVVKDSALLLQSWESFKAVFAAKVWGAWNLHQALQAYPQPLDFFVLFSSMTSILGSPGQSNYAAANAFLDGLAHYRHQFGLPATSINWGPWAEVGMAAELTAKHQSKGIMALQPAQGLSAFGLVLNHTQNQILVANINKTELVKAYGKLSTLLSEWNKYVTSPVSNAKIKLANGEIKKLFNELADETSRRQFLETYLKKLAADILRADVNAINTQVSLNALGIDSLMAVELAIQISEQLEYELPNELIFSGINFDKLIDMIYAEMSGQQADSHNTKDKVLTVQRSASREPVMTYSQERLWLAHNLSLDPRELNTGIAFLLEGKINIARLQQACESIVQRHDVMRTVFSIDVDKATPIVLQKCNFTIEEIDKSNQGEQVEEIKKVLQQEVLKIYDLTEGPLFRFSLIKLSPQRNIFLFAAHHLIVDGWAYMLFVRELFVLLHNNNDPKLLPNLPMQYYDFANWQRKDVAKKEPNKNHDYWYKELIDLPKVLDLPLDYPRLANGKNTAAKYIFNINENILHSLRELSKQHDVTLFVTLMAVFQVLLYRYSGQKEFIVGTSLLGHDLPEVQNLMGCFVNTLPISARIAPEESFLQLLKKLYTTLNNAYQHQNISFAELLTALKIPRSLAIQPLFQVMFIFQNFHYRLESTEELKGSYYWNDLGHLSYDFIFELVPEGNSLVGYISYDSQLFKESTIQRIATHYCELINSIAKKFSAPIAELELLTEQEQQVLLTKYESLNADISFNIHKLFEEQVIKTPNNIAVISDGEQITYKELNLRANQLAHYLVEQGVRIETPVAICQLRSIEALISQMAVLKAGGTYIPLDPNYPLERLKYMVNDANVRFIILSTEIKHQASILFNELPTIKIVDTKAANLQNYSSKNLFTIVSPDNAAYIIYTSGSTGQPKGIVISHSNINHYQENINQKFAIDTSDIFDLSASIAFDISVTCSFVPLLNGATIVICSDETKSDPNLYLAHLVKYKISFISITPSYFAALNQILSPNTELVDLRYIFLGAEALIPTDVQHWLDRFPQQQIVNEYGPTETTVGTTSFIVNIANKDQYLTNIPIGRAFNHAQLYVLDKNKKLCPFGVVGELYIGGHGLARGYLNRPELTAENFVADPFSKIEGKRLFKTGDLCRYLSDGNVEYIGRNDFQVKMRGFRVELGEIEAFIRKHVTIQDVVVMAREDNPGEKSLVAYCIVKNNEVLNTNILREYLLQHLPDYMLPAIFMQLESFPINANGKLDRKMLPIPVITSSKLYVAPRNEIEAKLAQIWQEVLKLEQISVEDNFFELGGHSLLATQVMSRIQQIFKQNISLRELFQTPTISHLAKLLAEQASEQNFAIVSILAASRSNPLPLSFAQERLWFLAQLEPDSALYNIPLVLRLKGQLNIQALTLAINTVIARHEILRTCFILLDDKPTQKIADHLEINITTYDLVHASKQEEELAALMQHEIVKPFDLSKLPLLRASSIQTAAAEYVFILNIHHSIADGWSMAILMRELSEVYKTALTGHTIELISLPIQYADFSVWQRNYLNSESEIYQQQLSYWKNQLVDAPVTINLPFDRPRPPIQNTQGANVSFKLNSTVTHQLKTIAEKENASLFMVLLAAFYELLYRYTGQTDIVIGSPIANRHHKQIENLIGFFANTLALRVRLAHNILFKDLIQHVKKMTLDAYEHQDLPYERLVDELHVERSMSYSPLFQVMFVLQNNEEMVLDFPGIKIQPEKVNMHIAKFDLLMSMVETPESLVGALQYSTALFNEDTVQRILAHWQNLLSDIVVNIDKPISKLMLLDETERQTLLLHWNYTQTEYSNKNLAQLFEEQVKRTPDNIAVVFEGQQLTYKALNEKANQLAHYLHELGIRTEIPVAVCMERSLEVVISLLGILKAGGVYVPLDASYPIERLKLIMEDAGAKVCISQQTLTQSLHDLFSSVEKLIVLDADAAFAHQSITDLNVEVTLDNTAYMIYTSGSTGKPKGVLLPQRTLANLISWETNHYALPHQAKTTQFASIGFDVSVEEMMYALLSGYELHIVPHAMKYDLLALAEFIQAQAINRLFLPTALLELFAQAGNQSHLALSDLHDITVAGEALKITDDIKAFFKAHSHISLSNEYGPSETHVVTSYQPDFHQAQPLSLIGKPIQNTQVYIVDEAFNSVPIGVIGELYLGGDNVAKGYLRRDELTQEKFIKNPFATAEDQRCNKNLILYKTGDLCRYLADGNIEYLGRIDHQVKIRGFRIELGEIENCLRGYASIQDVTVIAREDVANEKRLVAYYIVKNNHQLGITELREHLLQHLPDYMLPSAFMQLESFPLTPNGKLDRKALPIPEITSSKIYVAPCNELEAKLAEIWQSILKVEKVGVEDNFFELGGHSLLATQVITRVQRDLQKTISLREFFQVPSISHLVKLIHQQAKPYQAILPIVTINRDKPILLSFAQERLWFLDQLEPNSPLYNIPITLRLIGQLNIAALNAALNLLVARHEVLRTAFVVLENKPVQQIKPELNVALTIHDLTKDKGKDKKAKKVIQAEILKPFNLAQSPLIRATLVKIKIDHYIFILNIHHSVCDGWSLAIIGNELSAFYNAALTGKVANLLELPIQYGDFSVWQRNYLKSDNDFYQQQLSYWKNQLVDAPTTINLPFDYARPPVQSITGASESFTLSKEITEQLKKIGEKEGASLFMVLLAAFYVLLYRYTGQTDIVVGSPIANRNYSEIENLIGFFVNTLALRGRLENKLTFKELLRQVKQTTLGAYDHQDLPFEHLVDELKIERSLSHTPVFQVMFILQNNQAAALTFDKVVVEPEPSNYAVAKFDLTLSLAETEAGLSGSFNYSTALFAAETIKRLSNHWQVLIESIVAKPVEEISKLSLLTNIEYKKVIFDWNQTEAAYPRDKTIHQLFEEQVEMTPDNIAVVFEDQQLTYKELNENANQLANYLLQYDINANSLVAICLERSPALIISILAVLKVGSAYVPLDPAYPEDRIKFILLDTNASILITDSKIRNKWNKLEQTTLISFDDYSKDKVIKKNKDLENLGLFINMQQLAYVIYTSGSTGTPKGVLIEHAGLTNYLYWCAQNYPKEGDGTILHSSVAFDMAVTSIFLPLITGKKIYILNENYAGEGLVNYLQKNIQFSFIKLTPTHIKILNEQLTPDQIKNKAKALIIGGENLLKSDINYWHACDPNTIFINEYGPTEITVACSTYFTIEPTPHGVSIPIGKPIANMKMFILDKYLQPTAIGIVGELYIGGIGLARGYLNRPKLSHEKFVNNPFITEEDNAQGKNLKLYKSGDLCRYLADGNIEYLGRSDEQVKIRGFRIELAEIENTLLGYATIKEVIVLAREDIANDKRLVAYYIAKNNTVIAVNKLREYLLQYLPDYMVPSAFIQVEKFPLTPNGKLNHKLLPVPNTVNVNGTYIPPRDALELVLARIWSSILKIENIGVKDNFFTIGGHSLLAVELIAAIRHELQVDVPVAAIFTFPTIKAMADALHNQAMELLNSPVVLIQSHGTKSPLFIVHPVGGNVMCYLELSQHLEKDRPIYGVQQVDLPIDSPRHALEFMAKHYVDAIRKLQPQGPYYLAGWSLGGILAEEMAYQIEKQGEEVKFLGLIDSYPLVKKSETEIDNIELLLLIAKVLSGNYGVKIPLKRENLIKLKPELQFDYLLAQVKAHQLFNEQTSADDLQSFIEKCKYNVIAASYHQFHKVHCSITVFEAIKSFKTGKKHTMNEWSKYTFKKIETYKLKGDHYSILSKKHVKKLAQKINQALH